MLRKTTILMALAVAALALTAPGVASAEFTKHTAAITAAENISFTGLGSITGPIGGTDCPETHMTMTTSGGTTASITSYTTTNITLQCTPTGGLAFCTQHTTTATGLPWTVHTNTATMTITSLKVDTTFTGAFCPYHELTFKGPAISATPDNLHHMTKVTFSGTLEVYNATNTNFVTHVQLGGSLGVIPSGTYGIT